VSTCGPRALRLLAGAWAAVRGIADVDVRSLACVRIVLGALLAVTFINFAIYAPLLMSDHGVFPREMSLEATQSREFSLLLASGSAAFQVLVLLVAAAAAGLFACGVYPRVALVTCWVVFYSVTYRSTEYNFGLSPAMLGVLFWSLWVPWGCAPRSPLVQTRDRACGQTEVRHWALCGMFLSCGAVSYGAGVAKFRNYDAWFVNYSALKLDMQYYANVNPLTRAFANVPYFLEAVSPLVVIVEMAAPLVLLIPIARGIIVPVALVCASIVYCGIALSIHVGIFPLIPLVGFYLMVPGFVWEWCAARRSVRVVCGVLSDVEASLCAFGAAMLSVAQRIVRYVGVLLVGCFTVLAVHNQAPTVIAESVARPVERVTAPIFHFFNVRTKWDWIYGGAIRNQFLIVRLTTAQSSRLVNVTSVKYRGVMYNYFMNYSNAILRRKDDSVRLLNYARVFCSGRPEALAVAHGNVPIREVELFDVADPENTLAKLSADDQDALRSATKGVVPFLSFDCEHGESVMSGRGQGVLPRARAGSAVDVKILGWSQEYGALRLDRAVDGAPISLRGTIYRRGFGTHANSQIRLAVVGMRRFRSFVGIDDEKGSSPYGSALVTIVGDGRELYRSPVFTASTPRLEIDIDISGISELVLTSEDAGQGLGSNTNCDDHVSWADPRVE
jgi:hypothetical protein